MKTDNPGSKLYVAYEIAGVKYKDSLDFTKNETKMTKPLTQPVAAEIYTNNKEIKPKSVFLANNTLKIAITEKNILVQETKLQNDFLQLTANDTVRPSYFPLYGKLLEQNDTVELSKLGIIFDSLKADDIQKSKQYFISNHSNLLSLFSFSRYSTFYADYAAVEADFNLLPDWAKNSADGQNILSKINGAKSTKINTKAPDFFQKSSTGNEISLNLLAGKYIFLDFWASWCAPCRREHPNLINIYNSFKDKNFEIISISLDTEKENWLRAIVKDKITWTQISDLKGQQNDIAVKYGVQSIPANFLIDPFGTIIAINLSPQKLEQELRILLLRM
jgi:peroxiredoxin